mmetsp:Transcript_55426/g.63331  ORF Transcript_55426/g.63331 Transcript_55426/m.63331 type:complete len:193 (+) Transcript_55426:67-645(+)
MISKFLISLFLIALFSVGQGEDIENRQLINYKRLRPAISHWDSGDYYVRGREYSDEDPADDPSAKWNFIDQGNGTYCLKVANRYLYAPSSNSSGMTSTTSCGSAGKFTLDYLGDGVYTIKSYRDKYVYMGSDHTYKRIKQQSSVGDAAKWIITQLQTSNPSFMQSSFLRRQSTLIKEDEPEPRDISGMDDDE